MSPVMIAAEASTMASWDVAECGDGVQVAAMSWATNGRARKQNWRWGQSSANSSLLRLSLFYGENTGKFVEFRAGDGDRRPPSEWKFNRLQTEFPKHRMREIVRLKQGKQPR